MSYRATSGALIKRHNQVMQECAQRIVFKRWIAHGIFPIFIRIMALEENLFDNRDFPTRFAS
jgi:hypothetical protein